MRANTNGLNFRSEICFHTTGHYVKIGVSIEEKKECRRVVCRAESGGVRV